MEPTLGDRADERLERLAVATERLLHLHRTVAAVLAALAVIAVLTALWIAAAPV